MEISMHRISIRNSHEFMMLFQKSNLCLLIRVEDTQRVYLENQEFQFYYQKNM